MSQEQIKQFIEESQSSLSSGQFQQALDLAEHAIALEENTTEAHVLRAIALSQLNRPDEATAAFRNAIMYGPYNPKAYFNLAVHYFQLGEKLKAEEMAKEAMRIEPGHPGARQLLSTIENEKAAKPAASSSSGLGSFPGDPLAPPPSDSSSDAGSSGPPSTQRVESPVAPQPTPPANAPYGSQASPSSGRFAETPGGQQPPTPTGYYRPGYDASSQQSISFISNMGKAWDGIGIAISVSTIVIWTIQFIVGFGTMMKAMNSSTGPESFQQIMTSQPGGMALSLLGYLVIFLSMVWMIMDIVNRRSNWLWILPWVICCCCGLPGIPQLIYLWKGRP